MSGGSEVVLTVTRRGRALPLNAALWIVLCALVVLIAHSFTENLGRYWGEYWTGLLSLIFFVVLAWYSVRKRSLWFSVRLLRLAARVLPPGIQKRVVVLDRLETWRAVHITVGVLTLLPLWWHMSADLMSPLEGLLATAVAMLVLSGLVGVAIQDFLPAVIQSMPEHEVRVQDVNARMNATYVEAEEKFLGHKDALIEAYRQRIRPILEPDRSVSRWQLWRATLSRTNLGADQCVWLYEMAKEFGDEGPVWRELVDLAAVKINLELNAFNLHLSADWLTVHIALTMCTFALLFFHVGSVLYFYGL